MASTANPVQPGEPYTLQKVDPPYRISAYRDPLTVQHVVFARPHPNRPSQRQRIVFAFTRRDSGSSRLEEQTWGNMALATCGPRSGKVRPGRNAASRDRPSAVLALEAWLRGEVDRAAEHLVRLMDERAVERNPTLFS